MMFDRLYQAWVVSYSDGSLPMTDPLARPWELSCRGCLDEGECWCVCACTVVFCILANVPNLSSFSYANS